MAEFLTTKGTSHHLEQIVIGAKEKLVLVSPYLSISKSLLSRLVDADLRGVEITLIYGKDELKPEERQKLQELQRLSLYYHKDLHAKCFYNEKHLIITSMNMYEFSENTNTEMGVLIDKDVDSVIYGGAVREVDSILNHSEHKSIRRAGQAVGKVASTPDTTERARRQPKSRARKQVASQGKESKSPSGLAAAGKAIIEFAGALVNGGTSTPNKGYCIRCARAIGLDPERPYCPECYRKWAVWKKRTYTEKYCHQCGNANEASVKTSMAQPSCGACYWKHR